MYLHLDIDQYCGKIKKFISDPFAFNNLEAFLIEQNFLEQNIYRFFIKKHQYHYYRNQLIKQLQVNKEAIFQDLGSVKNELSNLDIKTYRQKLMGSDRFLLENYFIDYLVDYFDIKENGTSQDYTNLATYISFVHLSELIFHILNNDVEITCKRQTYFIYPNKILKNELKRRWLAMQYEAGSSLALTSNIILMSENLKKHHVPDEKKIEAIDILSRFILDRVFLINLHYLKDPRLTNNQYMKFIQQLCKFFALLVTECSVPFNKARFNMFGIDNEILNKILDINAKLPILDKGFIVDGSKLIYDESIDLYNILKSYTINSVNTDKSADLVANLGRIFEGYIRSNLIERFEKNGRYKVIPTSLDYNHDGVNADIDIIAFDIHKKMYYFIQCKYTINNKPYYKDEVKSFCNNKLFRKGLKQLSSIKEAMHQQEFIDKLQRLGIELNGSKNNYILILTHTSAQLDFQQVGDVVLYEWNTLRNLLDDGQELMCNINLTNPTVQVNHISSKLKLENVDSVVDSIFRSSTKDYKSGWNKFINSSFEIKLGDIHIVSNIR